MSTEIFRSGRWTGFYNYSGQPRKYPMDLILEFKNGIISGEGHDGIGGFVIAGVYSTASNECSWQKTYVARHTVNYRGFGENNGIWGTWTLLIAKGGFHIWPLSEGQKLAAVADEEEQVATNPQATPAAQSE